MSAEKPRTRYILERPLGGEDRFGHGHLAETIAHMARTHGGNFCAGLLGKYGVGKTFILDQVANLLATDKSVRVFRFDAWRYSDEPVQRAFLDALINQAEEIDRDKAQELLSKLYHSTTLPKRPIVAMPTSWKVFLGLVVASSFGMALVFLFNAPTPTLLNISNAILTAGLFGAIKTLFDVFKFAQGTHAMAWESQSIPAAVSTAQFEAVFGAFLGQTLKSKQHAVILVDEVDRCSHAERLSILKALRTYLRHARCFYVVASAPIGLECTDDPALHRKLFQVSYTIDPPHPEKLREYTASVLANTHLKAHGRDLVDVIYLANTREPRNALHFINTLIFAEELARRQDETEVCKNPAFLAKVLAIRRDWSSSFDELAMRPSVFQEWLEELQQGQAVTLDPELFRFLRITGYIEASDIRPYLAIARGISPRHDGQNDQLSQSLDGMELGLCSQLTPSEKYTTWGKAVQAHLRQHEQTSENQLLFNSIQAACSIITNVPEASRNEYASYVLMRATASELLALVDPGSATHIIPTACLAYPERAIPILRVYGQQFAGRQAHSGLASALEENHASLNEQLREAFNDSILARIESTSAQERLKVLKNLFDGWPRAEAVRSLVSPKLVEKICDLYVKSSSSGEVNAELERIIFDLQPVWNGAVVRSILELHLKILKEGGQPNGLSAAQVESINRMSELMNHATLIWDPDAALEVVCSTLTRLGAPNQRPQEAVKLMYFTVVLGSNVGSDPKVDDLLKNALTHFLFLFAPRLAEVLQCFAASLDRNALEKRLVGGLRAIVKVESSAVRPILSGLQALGCEDDYYNHAIKFFEQGVDSRQSALAQTCESSAQLSDRLMDRLAAYYCEMVSGWANPQSRRADLQRLAKAIDKKRLSSLPTFRDIANELCLAMSASSVPDDINSAQTLYELVGPQDSDLDVKEFINQYSRRVRQAGVLTHLQVGWLPQLWPQMTDEDSAVLLDAIRSALLVDSEVRLNSLRAIAELRGKKKSVDGTGLAGALVNQIQRGGQFAGQASSALSNLLQVVKVEPTLLKQAKELTKKRSK